MGDQRGRIRRSVRRHAWKLQVACTLVVLVLGGFYVNSIAADQHVRTDIARGDFYGAASRLGWLNVLLLIVAATLVAQHTIGLIEVRASRKDTDEAVRHLLRAAALALAGHTTGPIPLRAFCHHANLRTRELEPVCTTGFHYYSDESMPIPCGPEAAETFVIAEAFVERRVVSRELGCQKSPAEVERHIWEKLRDVIAAPIIDIDDPRICLGTISFDTSKREQQMHFHGQRAHDIVDDAAKGVALLWRGIA